MLKSISWQEFFSTIAVILGSYYIITALLLYSAEIIEFFKQRKVNRNSAGNDHDQFDSTESNTLMGRVKHAASHAQNVSREDKVDSEQLVISSTTDKEETIDSYLPEENFLKETATEISTEVKALAEIVSSCNSEEVTSFFQSLLSKYPQLAGTKYQDEVSSLILTSINDHCEFQLSRNEVNAWWPETENTPHDHQ